MQSPQGRIPSLFTPRPPQEASAILLLIENSVAMSAIWSDIRQQTLEPLLSHFNTENRRNPIKVFAVETLPVPSFSPEREESNGVHRSLDDIRFNHSPNNRLSTAKVNAAIDLLSSVTYNGKPVTFHLVLVAASSPIENPLLGIRQYAWFLLAEKLQQRNVSCHLVLARNGEDMSSLIGLYDKTRWLQGAVDAHPFIDGLSDSRYLFKFSAQPEPQPVQHNRRDSYDGFPLHIPTESTPAVDDMLPLTGPVSPLIGPSRDEHFWGNASYPGSGSNDTGETQNFGSSSLDPFFNYPGFAESVDSTGTSSQYPSSFASWLGYTS